MRYRITEAGAAVPVETTGEIVTAAVVLTLFAGIALLVMGVKGRQRWLQFWGGLTCMVCAAYFALRLFGVPG